MLNVTLISGGSGSKEMLNGLKEIFDNSIRINIIVNCFDNGKSTGLLRQFYGGKILGPSDLRKNQLYCARLWKTCREDFIDFLDTRFETKSEFNDIVFELERYRDVIGSDYYGYFSTALDSFYGFFYNFSTKDCGGISVANIVYAYLFDLMGPNTTSVVMSKVLGLDKHNIHVYSVTDTNSFLYGQDEEGWFHPEENIVIARKLGSGIKEVFVSGKVSEDVVDVFNNNTDVAIICPGTFWSSHAPTYIIDGFKEALKESLVPIYYIGNVKPDLDTIESWTSIDVYNKTVELLDNKNIIPIIHPDIFLQNMLDDSKHDGFETMMNVFSDFFFIDPGKNVFVFDYDDTLKSRTSDSNDNIKLFNDLVCAKYIVTNNDVSNVDNSIVGKVYSNYAHILWNFSDGKYSEIENTCVFDIPYYVRNAITSFVEDVVDDPYCVVHYRCGLSISIRPILKNRDKVVQLLRRFLFKQYGNMFTVDITGTTTLEVRFRGLNFDKYSAIESISTCNPSANIVYFGDEPNGNDKVVMELEQVSFVNVRDASYMNSILRFLCSMY